MLESFTVQCALWNWGYGNVTYPLGYRFPVLSLEIDFKVNFLSVPTGLGIRQVFSERNFSPHWDSILSRPGLLLAALHSIIRIFWSVFMPHPLPGSNKLRTILLSMNNRRILYFHLDSLNSCPGFIPFSFIDSLFCLNLIHTSCQHPSIAAFPETRFLAGLKRAAMNLLWIPVTASRSSHWLLEGLQCDRGPAFAMYRTLSRGF